MIYPFPIPDFISVPPPDFTLAINSLILDVNGVIIQSGGGAGATGFVTRRQLYTALNAQSNLSTIDTAVNGLAVTNPVWIEYKTSQTISQTGNLANFIATTLGYTPAQMTALWTLAGQQQP